jgi:hypothetical protein
MVHRPIHQNGPTAYSRAARPTPQSKSLARDSPHWASRIGVEIGKEKKGKLYYSQCKIILERKFDPWPILCSSAPVHQASSWAWVGNVSRPPGPQIAARSSPFIPIGRLCVNPGRTKTYGWLAPSNPSPYFSLFPTSLLCAASSEVPVANELAQRGPGKATQWVKARGGAIMRTLADARAHRWVDASPLSGFSAVPFFVRVPTRWRSAAPRRDRAPRVLPARRHPPLLLHSRRWLFMASDCNGSRALQRRPIFYPRGGNDPLQILSVY